MVQSWSIIQIIKVADVTEVGEASNIGKGMFIHTAILGTQFIKGEAVSEGLGGSVLIVWGLVSKVQDLLS